MVSLPIKRSARLQKVERVLHASEYRAVFRRGRCFRDPLLRIHFRPNPCGMPRLGLVLRRKVGGSVMRNRMKRLLREVFRRSKDSIPGALDVVLVPERTGEPISLARYQEIFDRFVGWRRSKPENARGRGRRAERAV